MLYVIIEGGLPLRNFIYQIYPSPENLNSSLLPHVCTVDGNHVVAWAGGGGRGLVLDHSKVIIVYINKTSIAYYMP